MSKSNQEFYVGWQEQAPPAYARRTRRFVYGLLGVVLLTAALLVLFQRPFANSTFEFGSISQVEGVFTRYPAPMLKVGQGDQQQGVLLVGFGKFGATQTLAEIEAIHRVQLEGQRVVLRGTRIYHDGKMALELTEGVASFMQASAVPPVAVSRTSLGEVTLRGEILDPKCALGVMLPAEGKPHRACAIRCIAGGIPPLLRLTNAAGETNYVLLRSRQDALVHQAVLPFVADQIQICGELVQVDDWLVLYTDPGKEITRLWPGQEEIAVCGR